MPRFLAIWMAMFPMIASAAEFKIGYVDMQKAVLETSDGKKAQLDLKNEFEKRREALYKMQTNMDKLNAQFERKTILLAKDVRAKQQLELQAEARKFQEAVMKNQNEMAKRQQELLGPIANKMSRLAGELAKREGFAMIVDKHAELVVYADETSDLTAMLIREYENNRG